MSQVKAYRITKLRSNNTLPSVRHAVSRSPTDKAQYWDGRWKYVTLARGRVELELPAVYSHIPRKRSVEERSVRYGCFAARFARWRCTQLCTGSYANCHRAVIIPTCSQQHDRAQGTLGRGRKPRKGERVARDLRSATY